MNTTVKDITKASLTILIASTALNTHATAETPKNPAYIELTLRPGNTRSISEADLFIPLYQDMMRMIFADLRVVRDSFKCTEGNFGMGYRHMVNNSFILGMYSFFDKRQTRLLNTFSQVTVGAEILSNDFDARVNGYFPERKRRLIPNSRPTQPGFVKNVVGSISQYNNRYESALKGFDVEVGAKIPTPGFKELELRVFGGGYYFGNRKRARDIAGPRGRIEARINDVFTPGSRITLGFEVSNDRRVFKADETVRRRTHFYGQFGLRIPLQWKSTRFAEGLQRRLAERVQRDVDVVANPNYLQTLSQGDLNRVEAAAIGADGKIIKVFHVNSNTAIAADKQDGTFESPFSTVTALQAFFAANPMFVDHSNLAIAFAGDQTHNASGVLKIGDSSTNSSLNSFSIFHANGPDTLTGSLIPVSLSNGVLAAKPGATPFDGSIILGIPGSSPPTINCPIEIVNTSFNLCGIDISSAYNGSAISIIWNKPETYTGCFQNTTLSGSSSVSNGLSVTTNGSAVGILNIGNSERTSSASASGFGNAFAFTANGNSSLTVSLNGVTCDTSNNAFSFASSSNSKLLATLNGVNGNTSNNGLYAASAGRSTLSIITDGNSTFNNNKISGVTIKAGEGTTVNASLNNTVVDTTTAAGTADNADTTNAGVLIAAYGTAGTTTVNLMTNGLTVNNAASQGMKICAPLVGTSGNNSTFIVNIQNSNFTNTQGGSLSPTKGSGLNIQATGSDAANASLVTITGTLTGNTFSNNTGCGLLLIPDSGNPMTITSNQSTATNNNTSNTAGNADIVIMGLGSNIGGAASNHIFNFNNTTIKAGSGSNNFGMMVTSGFNGGYGLSATSNITVNWKEGSIIGNANALGGLTVSGAGDDGNNVLLSNAVPVTFNIIGGLQISGFTCADGDGSSGIALYNNVAAGAGTESTLNIAPYLTVGSGIGNVLIAGNVYNLAFTGTTPAFSGTGQVIVGENVYSNAARVMGDVNVSQFFTPTSTGGDISRDNGGGGGGVIIGGGGGIILRGGGGIGVLVAH